MPEGKLLNYGFDENLVQIEKEAYVLGSNSPVPLVPHRPDGEWPDIKFEPQAAKYETSGCTIWGGENQTEMFVKAVYQFEPNYDERFSYLHCDVDPKKGTNPQNFYESARKDGLIDNEPMPDTLDQFLDENYLTPERVAKGQSWLARWSFYHDWLQDTSKPTIKGTLPLSPVALSVTAWFRDDNGLYIDHGQKNTHWCVAQGYVKPDDDLTEYHVNEVEVKKLVASGKIVLKIFDTYDYSKKLLHPDHRVAFAKRIYVEPKEKGEEEILEKSGLLDTLYKALLQLQDFLAKWKSVAIPPATPPANNLVNQLALAHQKHEGGRPQDLNMRLNNPGACRYSSVGYLPKYGVVKEYKTGNEKPGQRGFAQFSTYELGFLYLKNLIIEKAKKHPTWNLMQYIGDEKDGWAPASDNNLVAPYANALAAALNVSPTSWQLKNLL